jgi:hypothetical protein
MSNILRWELWVKGLIAAFIGGAANSFSAWIIAPDVFNFNDLHKLSELAIASGIISAALYLTKSPLPKLQEEEQLGVTNNTKTN